MRDIAVLISLGVTGAPFAKATRVINESPQFQNDQIDFNEFLLVFGKFSGLCTKTEVPVSKGLKPIWIPTKHGWEQVCISFITMSRY